MDIARLSVGKVAKFIAIVVIAFIVGAAVFFFFMVRSKSKAALRDAKNIRVALQAADIEMYGVKKTIFNPYNPYGLEDTVDDKVNELVDVKGKYRITSYDMKRHELTGMTYREGNYTVTFTKKNDEITWDVDYNLNVFTFKDTD